MLLADGARLGYASKDLVGLDVDVKHAQQVDKACEGLESNVREHLIILKLFLHVREKKVGW